MTKPYITRITNPWGDAVGGQVIVGNFDRQRMTATVTLRDHLFGTEQALALDQLRTLKEALDQGQPAQIEALRLAWGEGGAVMKLGSMRVALDADKRTSLITRLTEVLIAGDEQERLDRVDRAEVIAWGVRLKHE